MRRLRIPILPGDSSINDEMDWELETVHMHLFAERKEVSL